LGEDPATPNETRWPGYVVIPTFTCPTDQTPKIGDEAPTNYVGIWGDDADIGRPQPRGVSGVREVNMASITDGTSNTAMIGEVFRGKQFRRLGDGWVATGYRCSRWAEETAICGAATGWWTTINGVSTHVGMSPNYVDPSLPAGDPSKGDLVNWNDDSCACGGQNERRPVSSLHPGGAQCAYADGSVKFIPETVDATIWMNTGSMNGKEPNSF
jgi:prepilin-type processing-associated H-X9-DG protein